MKTLQTISTAILFSLTSISFANDAELSISIIEVIKPSCNGGSNGSATVLAKGGKAPYSYNWNTFPNQLTPEATNLKAGTYFVEVKDANGQVVYQDVKIDEPNQSTLIQDQEEATVDLTASVSGENGPYTYELNGELIQDDQEVAQLPEGIHKLVITDANECKMVQYIQVFMEADSNDEQENNPRQPALKKEQVKMKSKNERVEASDLIPTVTVGKLGNKENLVTVSNH